jgi:hypothetical protein
MRNVVIWLFDNNVQNLREVKFFDSFEDQVHITWTPKRSPELTLFGKSQIFTDLLFFLTPAIPIANFSIGMSSTRESGDAQGHFEWYRHFLGFPAAV